MADNEKVFTDLHDVLSQQNILMESIATKIQLIELNPVQWKVLTESATTVNLPSEWNELQIIVHEGRNNTNVLFNISRLAVKTLGTRSFTTCGGSSSNPTYSEITISENENTVVLVKTMVNDVQEAGTMAIFYR